MDSNFESRSPDNADKETSFPKSLTDKANRKYRQHSSVSRSASYTSDGSPECRRSPSPDLSKENPSRKYDTYLKSKDDGRELDIESGRGRFHKDSDSRRRSDRESFRSSRDYHKDGEKDRSHHKRDENKDRSHHKRDDNKDTSYYKRDDDKDRSYHRSSGYGRESRSDSRSDRTSMRQVSERDRSGDYRQSTEKYTKEKSYAEGHKDMDKDREVRRKNRDEDSTTERGTSGRKHIDSNANDSKHGGWDRHNKDRGGRDDRRGYGKNLADHKSKNSGYDEESTRRHQSAGKESTASYMDESERQKVDLTEKRKHGDRESSKHKERYSREIAGKLDNDSSPGMFKLLHADKDKNNGKDGQFVSKFSIAADERHPSSKLPPETVDKVVKEPAQPCSNEPAAFHDFNAAKDAALKAAELVNRNLVGGGYMSTDQKKKLLWGSKKNAAAVEEPAHRWDVPLFSDRERQEKFNKLMSLRLPWCLWPIVGCEGRCETSAQTRQHGRQRQRGYPIRKAGTAPVGFGEAIHCWTPKKGWSYGWTWSLNSISASEYSLSWIFDGNFFRPFSRRNHGCVYYLSCCFEVFGKRCLLCTWLNLDKVYGVFKEFVTITNDLVNFKRIILLISRFSFGALE